MSYYKHFIFACLAAIGACAVSCSDDTFGTDNNNIDGRLHFRAKVIQNKQLTKGSRAAQPADACIEARNIQGPSFQGKTIWLQERTINGIFPSLKQRAATRGKIIPSVDYLSYLIAKKDADSWDKSLFLWGYRAKNKQGSYETWFGKQKLKIDDKGTGTFVNEHSSENKYFWSADKPYCKFFALFGNDLDFIGNEESEPTCSYNGEGEQTCSYNDKDKPTTHLKFTCSEYVSEQFDLLAASKDVDYNQEKGATVDLELCHALTAVQFSIGNLPKDYKLKEVELRDIKTEGIYTFPTADKPLGEWNFLDKKGTLSLSFDTDLSNKNTIAVGVNPLKKDGSWNDENNDTFFVIPQKYENIKVYLLLGKNNPGDPQDHRPDNIPIVIPLDKAKLDKDKRKFSAGTTKIFNLSFDNSWNTFITEGPGTIYVNADSVNFNVFSYSKKKSDINPEQWEYVGYEDNNGDIQNKNPDWLTVDTKQGVGGHNVGNITIRNSERKTTFPWDDDLVQAKPKGKKDHPYNLANKNGEEKIEETANCYVISAPGTYAIPLVYGNAIKDGVEDSATYTFKGIEPDDKEAASSILKKFVNAAGEKITSPYIEGAERAEMLWQDKHQEDNKDKKDIVSNLQIKDIGKHHYLQFEVLKENIQSGNALVAVRNHDGKILWSWHLWFVPEEEYGGTAYYNGRNIAEYPLGYTPYTYGLDKNEQPDRKVKLVFRQKEHPEVVSKFTVEQKYKTEHLFYMTYYQHGRKDPFSGDVVHAQNKIEAVDGKQSLAYGIQHPNELINFNITENWCEQTYFNLWSANATISDLNPYNNVKTIYDPCPVGYKVPPANTFDGMDEEGGKWDEDRYGWTFKIMIKNKNKKGESENLFIPMTGNVMYDLKAQKPVSFLYYVKNGEFPYPMAEGFYQLATAVKSADKSHSSKAWLYLAHDGYTPSYKTQNVADAEPVLPIKDE